MSDGKGPGRYEFGFCAEIGGVEFDVDVVADLEPDRTQGIGLDATIVSVTFSDGGGDVPEAICDALDLECRAVEHFMDYAPMRLEFLPGLYTTTEGPRRECDLIGFVKDPCRAYYYALITAPDGVGFVLADYAPFRAGEWTRVDGVPQRVVRKKGAKT